MQSTHCNRPSNVETAHSEKPYAAALKPYAAALKPYAAALNDAAAPYMPALKPWVAAPERLAWDRGFCAVLFRSRLKSHIWASIYRRLPTFWLWLWPKITARKRMVQRSPVGSQGLDRCSPLLLLFLEGERESAPILPPLPPLGARSPPPGAREARSLALFSR